MGMTIAEKIIAAAAGVDSVKPGDIYTVQLDHLMSNDGTTHLTVDMYNNKLKNPHIADTKKLVFIVDHNVPSDSPKTAASQKKMRDFARENNIDFWEGKGVCHHDRELCPSGTADLWCRQPYLFLWSTWRFRYRCRMYRLSLWNGNRNFLGYGTGNCEIQPDRETS